jgi:hypothetical protein
MSKGFFCTENTIDKHIIAQSHDDEHKCND